MPAFGFQAQRPPTTHGSVEMCAAGAQAAQSTSCSPQGCRSVMQSIRANSFEDVVHARLFVAAPAPQNHCSRRYHCTIPARHGPSKKKRPKTQALSVMADHGDSFEGIGSCPAVCCGISASKSLLTTVPLHPRCSAWSIESISGRRHKHQAS